MIYVLVAFNFILLGFSIAITRLYLREKQQVQMVEPLDLDVAVEQPSKDIRKRYPRKPTAQDYYTLFEAHPIGQDVLEDLISIFGGTTYVRGGQDADRETCFRAGRKHVVDHILIQINRANQTHSADSEVSTDD